MAKCLVTGGAGFIGSNLVDRLRSLNHDVIIIDNESANNEKFYWRKDTLNIKEDIIEIKKYQKYFKNIDFVFHLAAESRITNAIQNPTYAYQANIIGTNNILKASLDYGIKRLVFSSTSSIYGLNKPPNSESDKDQCLNPYSISKFAAEKICQHYLREYKLPVTILRYFNVFGERAPSNGHYAPVTAIFLKQFNEKKPLTIVGNGNSKRDFIYVQDVINANINFCFLNQKKSFNDIFNVGFGKNISVKKLANIISKKQINLPERIGEAKETLADISKIKKIIRWKPTIKIEDWIKKFI